MNGNFGMPHRLVRSVGRAAVVLMACGVVIFVGRAIIAFLPMQTYRAESLWAMRERADFWLSPLSQGMLVAARRIGVLWAIALLGHKLLRLRP